jgi:hypothetical protein
MGHISTCDIPPLCFSGTQSCNAARINFGSMQASGSNAKPHELLYGAVRAAHRLYIADVFEFKAGKLSWRTIMGKRLPTCKAKLDRLFSTLALVHKTGIHPEYRIGETLILRAFLVVGYLPPGSTTLRLRLRVAQPRSRRRSVPRRSRQAKTGSTSRTSAKDENDWVILIPRTSSPLLSPKFRRPLFHEARDAFTEIAAA